MKIIRVAYYIFFGLFAAMVIFISFVHLFFATSASRLSAMFPDAAYPLKHGIYNGSKHTLDYYETGPDTAALVFFVHGSPGSWDNYARIMAHRELYTQYHLIAVNRIGYGVSEHEGGVASLEEQVESFWPLVMEKSAGHPPLLVGHSMGGPVVLKAAMMHSAELKGVISLAGSFDPELEPHEWYRGLYKIFPVNLFMQAVFKSSNDELFTHKKELQEMENGWKDISCPVYIFQGLSDDLVDYRNADFAEKKLSRLQSKKIIRIPGENHFIPWTKDSMVVRSVIEMEKK